jgi:hypothetical protein
MKQRAAYFVLMLVVGTTMVVAQEVEPTPPAEPASPAEPSQDPAAEAEPAGEAPIAEAAPTVGAEAAAAAEPAEVEKATLVFFRMKRMAGAALNTSVYIDGVEIADLDNGTYIKVALDPGTHTFHSDEEKDAVDLEITPGELYYVKVGLKRGLWKGHGELIFMDREEGIKEFEAKKLKPAKDVRVPELLVSE